MVNLIIAFPHNCTKIICNERIVLWLSGILGLASTTLYNRLMKMCTVLIDWFEDRDSNNYSVDTSSWGSKTMLIYRNHIDE